MGYKVILSPGASAQLIELYEYIADHGSPLTAERYVSAIADYCQTFSEFPNRGTKRDDIRPGLRTTHTRAGR